MLPQTPHRPGSKKPVMHESINDLPVHPWTRRQVFHPTSESRAFAREDAARAAFLRTSDTSFYEWAVGVFEEYHKQSCEVQMPLRFQGHNPYLEGGDQKYD